MHCDGINICYQGIIVTLKQSRIMIRIQNYRYLFEKYKYYKTDVFR